ncbi:DUF4177 domain-containing protein [Rhodobacter sp. 24-YEA-8]|uniref:DUF4177 domain-containing protein n=1 Tax=Rhodobacter sp. 24-YEA-8 TaxID=1884310 RepID=UPI00089D0FB9|nr:DUF4177 domain-containing protein [Rhodobacter sp. 24-YEA-8]SEB64159.1 protein of unknown function [Rhodobacter sp. 24-YEA-8]
MQRFEYKVVPAPRRGEKARGVKSAEERFALALSTVMNELGAEGWDYVRADSLPCDERSGLTGTKTSFQNMLVFRREILAEAPRAPVFTRAAVAPAAAPAEPAPAIPVAAAPETAAVLAPVLHAQPREVNSAPSLGPARPEVAAE